MADEIETFQAQVAERVARIGQDMPFAGLSDVWIRECVRVQYPMNFSWLGRPVVQIPQDLYAVQELVWAVRPDLIIETGIAHGGSLILSASMLALLDYADAVTAGASLTPGVSQRRVLGIDIDIRAHNRAAIEAHPLSPLIEMIQGSSIDPDVVARVQRRARDFPRVMVFLDSNHTHDHVLAELHAYAPLVSVGSYCVVWDSGLEDMPEGFVVNRPWGKGNNPKTALLQYLRALDAADGAVDDGMRFEIDKAIEHKITLTSAADGFLRRVR